MNEQAIFLAALDIADTAERAAYLSQSCSADLTLRRQVDALLAAHDRPGSFLDIPALEQIVGPSPAETSAEQHEPAGGNALGFLQPSRQPGSLGRLGHYEVHEVIGRGGCGIVLKAFDDRLQRWVAIKVMAPELAATSPARKRFLREARAAAAVRHENIVGIHAVEESPVPFLVMEYIAGQTLQQRLDQHGPLDLQEILHVGSQIASGLDAAHSMGLIHRDIKPSNILLEEGKNRLKITDFGLARASDDASITQSGVIAGTPLYMSPEQAYGDAIDRRSDLFSLGSVLYVMCSGRPPFRAANTMAVLKRVAEDQPRPIQEIIPEIPQWLIALIEKLLAKKPEDRFASAQEVAALLARRELELSPHELSPQQLSPQRAAAGPASLPTEIPNPFAATPEVRPVAVARPAPVPSQSPRVRSTRWVSAAVVLLALSGGLSLTEGAGLTDVRGTVIRLLSPDGTLVVEVDDPGVSVRVEGEEIVITGTGAKEIRLRPGQYKVLASKDGKIVRQELVTVARNGRQVLRISKEAPPAVLPPPVAAALADPVRKSAEYVLSIGGRIAILENSQERPITTAGEFPAGAFELVVVDLAANAKATDAGLALFKGCKTLRRLYLKDTQISDVGLANFTECKNLVQLFLQRTKVSDEGLFLFKDFKNLTNLHLDGTRATDAGLANFKGCKNLAVLGLDGSNVSDAGLEGICGNLTHLGLNNTRIGDAGLARLRICRNLTHLHLNDTQASDEGLEHLKQLKGVTHIDLKNTKVTTQGVEDLARALPKCKLVWDGGVIEPLSN